MKSMFKRLLSLLMAMFMVFTMMPTAAFADEASDVPDPNTIVGDSGALNEGEQEEIPGEELPNEEQQQEGLFVIESAMMLFAEGGFATGESAATLQDAVDKAGDNGTVVMTGDVTGKGVVINKNITIDFGGHTYTVNECVGSAGTETLGFQIQKGCTVTLKNGTLAATTVITGKPVKMLVQNYANLNLVDMILDGTGSAAMQYVLSNNSGEISLSGATSITAPEGAVAFDVYDYSSAGYAVPRMTINTTGTVTGKIEVSDTASLSIASGTFTDNVSAYLDVGLVQDSVTGEIVSGLSNVGGLKYAFVTGGVQITDGKCASGDVVIPATISVNGNVFDVVGIAGNAFNDANEVTSVVVPNSVTTLGGAAFANMDKLKSLTIGNGVTSWGSKLAVNNYELETVVIAEGATLIGDLAFRTCPKLANVTLPSTLKTIGATAFTYAAITELTIPASVESIGADAFKDIDTLKKVTFLGENTKLGSTSFQMCDGLEEVILPAKLTVIPQGAFRYCTALKTINFPESLTEIGNYSFQGCTSLESVTISKNITNLVTNAFNGCTSLKNLTIEEGFAGTIGGYVFQGCTALESVVIPSSMETVGESMFNMCSNLKNVTLSEGVKILNISAFANCTSLETLTLPDSLERMRHGSIANCTALKTLIVTGDNLPVIEHSNALDGLSEELVVVYSGDDAFTGNWAALADNVVNADENDVALVGNTGYDTLAEAIAAANAIVGGATVELLQDVTLGEKLTISGDVTIEGEFTITRDDAYTGTLFTVNAGAELTLDGGLTIDGNNNWTLNEELYNKALNREVTGVIWAELITSEENKPNATAPMFKVTGAVIAKNVTIQNNYSSKESNNGDYGVFQVDANATLTMTGATIKHIVTGGANSVVHLSTNSVWTMNDGSQITDTFAGKNGGICRNDSGKFVMNGGEICTNRAINTNGTVIMLYKGSMEMNGGTICHNTGISGSANGRCAPIYGHSTSTFVMTDGTIKENQGISYGGVDVPSSIKVEISGGYVGDNISSLGNPNADVNGNANTVITGGTFTQDVSEWLAPDTGLVYDETTGTYSITKHVYNLYFRDPATGEQVQGVGPLQGNDPASLVATGKLFYADYYKMELEVLSNAKIDETIVIDYPMTVNLNGKTISATGALQSTPVFRILSDVTITGNGTVDGTAGTSCYAFIVGNSTTEGKLTIADGTYKGDVTAVSITKGTANIKDGTFEATEYEGAHEFTLNCIDANYKNGTAVFNVTGGNFYKFNPADNAAEGAGTSFAAAGYKAVADGDYFGVEIDKDALDPIVTITFTDSSNGTVTLKYPSERFDTIQKLIGTNDYADFVLGATQSELLAYVGGDSNGNHKVTDIVLTLHDDIELDAPINFYNKYFQIPVEYAITLDGDGHTITWADGYNGTLINVESGVSLEMKNVTIDGENAFTFYDDTTTVENDQNWYTRFVNVGEEDKAVNADVIVNAGNLTLGEGTKIQNVTIASDHADGKTENTETGYILKYNQDLALIKSNGGMVNLNGASITGNAGLILNAVKAETAMTGATINGNMGAGNKGGIIIANGGTMSINNTSICGNKAMARSATILGVINGAEVEMKGNSRIDNNKQIGVGSNTAGAMIVLEGASQFVMDGGSISDNVGGRAGAIASRWVGGSYGQHEEDSFVLNAGTIAGNTASNDSWNGASVFLRSPTTIGEGMKIDGIIAVDAGDIPGELSITGGQISGELKITKSTGSASITGGTFDYDPAEWLAEDYGYDVVDGKYTVKHDPSFGKVAQVGNVLYSSLKDALEACTNGETVKLIADITYGAGDIVNAIGGATGFGLYPNPAIIDIGGSRDEAANTNYPSQVNAVLDLNGHTITNNADAYLFLIMDNAKLKFTDSVGGGKVITTVDAPAIWTVGTDTLVTIEDGEYVTASATGLLHITHGGDMVITGGTFRTTAADKSLLVMLNTKDRQNSEYFISGKATVTIFGGFFEGFNPEKVMDDSKTPFIETNGCAEGYAPVDNGNGTYGVVDYVKWIKAELLAGNDVVLERDIVVDGSMIESIPAPTNSNGYYYNPGIFNVVGDYDVTFDLNGHTITYNGHAVAPYTATFQKDKYYNTVTGKYEVNSCTIAHGVFFANADADLTIIDGSTNKAGTVMVYGMASGAYVASPGSSITIEGGTWKNVGCGTCGGTNIFLYPLQGGELYITGGHFDQALDSAGESYLIVEHGGAYVNSVIDYSKTKVEISGGTFVGMNPGEIKKFNQTADNKLDTTTEPTTDGCADGFIPTVSTDDEGTTFYGVKPGTYVAQIEGGKKFETLTDAITAAQDGNTVKLLADVEVAATVVIDKNITLDLNGKTVTAAKTVVTSPVFRILGKVTAKNGTVDGTTGINSYAFIVGSSTTSGELNIADGTYKGVTSAISITNGIANISGGKFMAGHDGEGEDYGAWYLLNCNDDAYKKGDAKFKITGGEFYGFDPKNNASEGEGTNYLDGGWASVYNSRGYWTVKYAGLVAQVGGTKFMSIADAVKYITTYQLDDKTITLIYEGENGEAIEYTESMVMIPAGVTLDLNGKTLETTYLASFGDVIDGSENETAVLKCAVSQLTLAEKNKEMPIKTDEGYVFRSFKLQHQKACTDDTCVTNFRPVIPGEPQETKKLFADGIKDNGLSFVVRVEWINETGDEFKRDFVYGEDLVKVAYGEGKTLMATIYGINNTRNVAVSLLAISETGVIFGGLNETSHIHGN